MFQMRGDEYFGTGISQIFDGRQRFLYAKIVRHFPIDKWHIPIHPYQDFLANNIPRFQNRFHLIENDWAIAFNLSGSSEACPTRNPLMPVLEKSEPALLGSAEPP